MQNLKQIVHLIKDVKLKASDLITSGQTSNTKVNTFYKKILNGDFDTDQEAAQFFYNSDINSSSYKNLKSALRGRLINTLFFLDTGKYNEREGAYLYCSKFIMAAKILISLNLRNASIDLCHKVLRKALHFEFTDHIIEASYYLSSHYALVHGNLKKFEHFNQLLKNALKAREAENLAQELYLRILIPYTKSTAIHSDTHQQTTDACEQLEPFLAIHSSPFLHYITYYIESLKWLTVNNHLETIKVCKKAILFFENKPFKYKSAMRAFLHQKIVCYIQLKMYEEGQKAVDKSNSLLQKGSHHWYVNLDLCMMLALHSKKYQEAYYIFNKAANHKKYKRLNPRIKEKWTIIESYIHFLVYVNKISPIKDDKRFSTFRMGKFLNSVPTFYKDKRGLNIPILVIQIVFMIVKKDYDRAVIRIESIEKYCSRYLKKGDNFRSNCFIKMLLQIPISGFHKAGTQRRAKKYFDKLKTVSLEIANQANEVEIIPYEDMWEIIIESLDVKFIKL